MTDDVGAHRKPVKKALCGVPGENEVEILIPFSAYVEEPPADRRFQVYWLLLAQSVASR